MTPGVLLATDLPGRGSSGVTAPAWQAIIPNSSPTEIRATAVLGSVSVNVGRVVGPALAGLLIAAIGVGLVFALNAASFVSSRACCVGACHRHDAPSRRERFLPALRAGGGYVRWSPFVRRVLIRAALFLLPATAIWALLPLVATETLHLDAAGYGLLLGALGLGAIGGVLVLGRLHARFSEDGLLALASLAYAAAMAVLVLVPLVAVAFAVLIVAGMAWLTVLSTVNATLQTFLPGWVRARGLAFYLMCCSGRRRSGRDLGCRRRAGRPDRHVRRGRRRDGRNHARRPPMAAAGCLGAGSQSCGLLARGHARLRTGRRGGPGPGHRGVHRAGGELRCLCQAMSDLSGLGGAPGRRIGSSTGMVPTPSGSWRCSRFRPGTRTCVSMMAA